MTLCRLMCLDFMEQIGPDDYSVADLEEGAAYAKWLLSDGFVTEPFYRFDLAAFLAWCMRRLRDEEQRP